MDRIRKKVLPKGPLAAGVVTGSISAPVVKKAVRQGADILEVRLDTFKDLTPEGLVKSFKKLKASTGLPLLATVRSRKEGGSQGLSDQKRAEVFKIAMPFSDFIDIELSSDKIIKSVVNFAHKQGGKVIISFHDFKATPADTALKTIIKRGRATGGDFIKIAAKANSRSDVRRLAGLLASFDDLIVVAMGGLGAASRVFFPMLGSYITYGALTEKTAPGQLPLKLLKKEMRLYGIQG